MIGDPVMYVGSDNKTHEGKLAHIQFRPEHWHAGTHHPAVFVAVVLHSGRYVVVPLDALEHCA